MTAGHCVVTGAGGFIGYQLANALAADGQRVVGVDLRFPDPGGVLGPPRFAPVRGDFRDTQLMETALSGATVLFHLASAHLQVSAPDTFYWDVNVHSLPGLMHLALEAGVKRCVHVSSVGVYGDVGSSPANEDTCPRPQSIYGETKLAGERAMLDLGTKYGLEVVVLRPSWVYGAGCPRTAKLYRALRRRRFLMVGEGTNLRQPIYIDDMIDAFRLAATKGGTAGQIIVIAGERAVTTRELVEAFCAAFSLPRPVIQVPYTIGASAALGAESICSVIGREPPISRRTLEFFKTNNAFDISRARALLGFEPRYSLAEGLVATRARLAKSTNVGHRNSIPAIRRDPRKRILVTGATGFTGGHLCTRLARDGFSVRALVRDPGRCSSLINAGVELAIGDLRDPDSLERAVTDVDVVYHIAGLFRPENVSRRDMWAVNVEGTGALLEAAVRAGVERFVHCSTAGVHGDIENPPANEQAPYSPGDSYQESKTEGERIALRYMAEGRIPVVVFRPAGIYGPGDTRFLKLIKAVNARRFVMLGRGTVQYQLVFIEDLIDGILLCGTSDSAPGNVYLLTGESPITLNDLVRLIAGVLNVPPPRWHFPVAPVYAAGFMCEMVFKPLRINPPIYRRRVDFFRKTRAFDISKAKLELGFQPRTALRSGLETTIAWYRQSGLL